MGKLPTFAYEKELISKGYQVIVGVDEAGCGALAGPVVAGAVVIPLTSRLGEIKDSKLLSESVRERLYDDVCAKASAWAVGQASVEEIFEIGIRPATYLAMTRAVEQIKDAQAVLVDAWTIPNLKLPQQGIIKGDRLVKSIAAASILAKVSRDRQMRKHAEQFPEYGFEAHKGYGTKMHRDAIKVHGACAIHRLAYKTFHIT